MCKATAGGSLPPPVFTPDIHDLTLYQKVELFQSLCRLDDSGLADAFRNNLTGYLNVHWLTPKVNYVRKQLINTLEQLIVDDIKAVRLSIK